jgi:hypothetical protein
MGSSKVPVLHVRSTVSTKFAIVPTSAIRRQWSHVEDINALHLSEDFETFETSGLLEIGGNGTWSGTRGQQIGLGLDLCGLKLSVVVALIASYYCILGMNASVIVPSKGNIVPCGSPGLGSSLSAPAHIVSHYILGLRRSSQVVGASSLRFANVV